MTTRATTVDHYLNSLWPVRPLIDDPLLTELWLVAICGRINAVTPRIHADVVDDIASREWPSA